MTRLLFASAAALALLGSAHAFDNSTCKAFLAGTWNVEADMEQNGQKFHYKGHSTYSADGQFKQHRTVEMAGQPAKEFDVAGTWDAKPGAKPDECDASISVTGMQPMSVVLTVVDDNSVKGPDGHIATREH